MPAGDGTGPFGYGPLTGRRAGYCAGYPVPGYMNPLPGRGLGARSAYWGLGAPYGWGPHCQSPVPWGYGFPYSGNWPGWFGGRRGRRFGRGWGRGYGFGRGWGRW